MDTKVCHGGGKISTPLAPSARFFLTGRAKKFPTETKESRAEHSFTYFFNSQTPFSVGALNKKKKKNNRKENSAIVMKDFRGRSADVLDGIFCGCFSFLKIARCVDSLTNIYRFGRRYQTATEPAAHRKFRS